MTFAHKQDYKLLVNMHLNRGETDGISFIFFHFFEKNFRLGSNYRTCKIT